MSHNIFVTHVLQNEALNLHVAIRDWSSRDNEIVAVAKRMAVLMAKLSNYMNNGNIKTLTYKRVIYLHSCKNIRMTKLIEHLVTVRTKLYFYIGFLYQPAIEP